MEEDNQYEDSSGRILRLRLASPWAWFYYSIFGIQLVVVSVITIYRQVVVVSSDPITDTYLAILKEVSPHVPAMAAYSMALAVIVEGVRMLVDGILEKRYRKGRRQGREDAQKEWAALVGHSPTIQAAIQAAIESGEIKPPPFLKDIDGLNGNHRT